MAKAPDWLLNMTNSAKGLVDDSPQFRQLESALQKRNLEKAADSALGQLQQRVNNATADSIRQGAKVLEDMKPMPVPLQGPEPFFPKDVAPARTIPGPEDFDMPSAPATAVPPQDSLVSMPADQMGTDEPSGQNEDIQATVQRMSDITGIPADQIATFALLGKEIHRIEQEKGAAPPPAPPATPQPAQAGMPIPLQGPPTQPSSLVTAPPTM